MRISVVFALSFGWIALGSAVENPSLLAADKVKWASLLPAVDPDKHAVAGEWKQTEAGLTVSAAQRARVSLPFAPTGEYDIRITFTRKTGVHSIALFVPHGTGQVSVEVDAWGEHLGGLQNIDGKSLRENPTRKANFTLKNGQKYTLTVEVRKDQIRALLDDAVVATHHTDGTDLSLPDLWKLPDTHSLGLGAWDSETTFHRVEARLLNGKPLPRLDDRPVAGTPPTTTPPTKPATKPTAGKRVVIVIANHHFFYREYADPRAELEQAGIKVTVAAGRKAACRPHDGSGQGADGGIVQPDLAIADVKADDYDAILFSGGWGSSAYQFAFPGRYNEAAYNGDPRVKADVNRLVGEFLAQKKYACALCNAVSVLAWARVDGKSPLQGKRVCAPTRQAAAGIYNGRPAQPSCRWHPEANGAKLSPAGAIGRPGTAEDDVLVDGLIVTGEDDISARAMGRQIAELLAQ